jgi:enterochelin esterase-like enzyme
MDALEKFTRVFSQSGVVWTNEMWDAWRELDAAYQAMKPKEKLEIEALSPADMKRATNTPWQDKSSY